MKKHSLLYKYLTLTLLLLAVLCSTRAANRYSAATGNWNSTATWSATEGGAAGASVPTAADAVYIRNGNTVTVNIATAACLSIEIGLKNNGAGTLAFNSGSVLTVSGDVILGEDKGSGNPTGSLIMTNGGLLKTAGSVNAPNLGTWTTGTGTIEYNSNGIQTVYANTYNNLILSGTSAKTTTGVTVNGILSMEGTATATAAPAYGGSATLQYHTTTSRTAGVEWLATFASSGGVIIGSTGSITLNAAKVFNASIPLTINTGATLITNNFQLTFGGNFINAGTFTAGSSPIVIAGNMAAQSISGFTTTGLVSMTKTGGTATFQGNINGAGLTINGAGTLNLGNALTHTFPGTWTRTAGTLNGGSTTLRLGSSYSGTGGTFTAGSGTVEYYASGVQSVAPVTYNNLTLTGTSAKTFPAGTTTVNGTLSLEGTATTLLTGSLNYGASSSLQYKGSVAQTTGGEFPATFSGTGGVIIDNAIGVLLGGNRTVASTLILETGTFSINSNTLTLQTGNTPVSRTSGTISTTSSSNLSFGSAGNTGGNAFTLPAGLFTSNPVPLNNLSVFRTNQLTLGDQMLNISNIVLCNGPLQTNGNLTLLSTAAGTAIIDGSGTGIITGNVTMQRYLATGGYKYISSPLNGSTVNQFSEEVDLGYWFPTFYAYEEDDTASGWIDYTDPGLILNPLEGYAANFGPLATVLIVNVTGMVNNGSFTRTLYNNNQPFTQGFNLVGNPYPSPIDWDAPSGWTKTNIDNALYYFRASGADEYSGTYSSYVNGISSDGIATNIIPSMQAFFVHVTDDAFPGTLSTTNSVRINDQTQSFIKSEATTPTALVKLFARFSDNPSYNDPVVLYLHEKGTDNFDNQLDAYKRLNTDPLIPNFYCVAPDGKKLSINAFSAATDSFPVVPLGVMIDRPGQIEINIMATENLQPGTSIYLHDSETGTDMILCSEKGYKIYLAGGEYNDRFSIRFINKEKYVPENWPGQDLLNAYALHGKLIADINVISENKGRLAMFNLSGQVVFSKEINSIGYNETDISLKTGIYIINYITGKLRVSKKIFISNQ